MCVCVYVSLKHSILCFEMPLIEPGAQVQEADWSSRPSGSAALGRQIFTWVLGIELKSVPKCHKHLTKPAPRPRPLTSILRCYMYGCFAWAYVCTPHVLRASGGLKRVLDALERELRTVVSCHAGAGNLTWVLCKSS